MKTFRSGFVWMRVAGFSLGWILSTQAEVTRFGITNSWRFQQTTNFDGVAWQAPGFDDSGWPAGPGLLYVETNPAVEPRLTPLILGRMTYYFRTHFSYFGSRQGLTLTFSNRIDDGAVFYLNGAEIQRVRLPLAPTMITYATTAGLPPGTSDATSFDVFSLSGSGLTNLAVGDNVLAVEVHQNSSSSSDIVFGCALSTASSETEVAIVRQPADATVLDGRPARFWVETSGTQPISYQWFKEGQPIAGAALATNLIGAVAPADAGLYQVVASNLLNVVTSAPARLTVLEDHVAPQLLSAVRYKSSNTVTVSFSESVEATSATNVANYDLRAIGQPLDRLSPLSATLLGDGVVLLSIAPPAPGAAYRLRVTNVTDLSSARNPVPPDSVIPVACVMDLVAINETTWWRYEASGAEVGEGWREPGYNDLGWSNGLALFDGRRGTLPSLPAPCRTLLGLTNAAGTAQVVTYFFRTRFLFDGPLVRPVLRLWKICDDGAVFYLNGAEVLRTRMPSNGPITPSTWASASVSTASAEPPLTGPGWVIPASSLAAGENLLAVEVHQDGLTSPDVTFGAALEVTVNDTPAVLLSLPAMVPENAGTLTNRGLISLTAPPDSDLLVQFNCSAASALALPASLLVPAGQTNAAFSLTLVPDGALAGPQTVRVTAQANHYDSGEASMVILDSDTSVLTVSFPAMVPETAGTVTGVVTSAQAPATDFAIQLSSSDPNTLRVPSSLLLPAGQTTAVFTATVPDDPLINGTRTVTITAGVTNWTPGSVSVEVRDNEGTDLLLTLPQAAVEGDGVRTNAGQLRLQGLLLTNLVVALATSDSTKLTVPATVTVPAGQSNVSFDVTIVDNALTDGTKSVVVLAEAPGFRSASGVVSVADNDVHHYQFSALDSPQTIGVGFPLTLVAADVNGLRLNLFTNWVNLQAVSGGQVVPGLATNAIRFSAGEWSGNLTCTSAIPWARVVANLPGGGTSESQPFDVEAPAVRTLSLAATDVAYVSGSGRLWATIAAQDAAYPNSLVELDPVSGTVIASFPIGPDPTRMEQTDNGQYLYVVVSNATAVRQFDLDARRVNFTIVPPTDPQCVPALVQDLATVAGSPNRVVLANRFWYCSFGEIRLFDHGVSQPSVVPVSSDPQLVKLERSGVPGVVYEAWQNAFIRLQIKSDGIAQLDQTSGLITPGARLKAANGLVYTVAGEILDPQALTLAGTYPGMGGTGNQVETDAGVQRTLFLSPQA